MIGRKIYAPGEFICVHLRPDKKFFGCGYAALQNLRISSFDPRRIL
jgi:hypothetical protein